MLGCRILSTREPIEWKKLKILWKAESNISVHATRRKGRENGMRKAPYVYNVLISASISIGNITMSVWSQWASFTATTSE